MNRTVNEANGESVNNISLNTEPEMEVNEESFLQRNLALIVAGIFVVILAYEIFSGGADYQKEINSLFLKLDQTDNVVERDLIYNQIASKTALMEQNSTYQIVMLVAIASILWVLVSAFFKFTFTKYVFKSEASLGRIAIGSAILIGLIFSTHKARSGSLKPSEVCINMIAYFEGFESEAYLDPVGIPTIGYGFIEGVKIGDTISIESANVRLQHELIRFEKYVKRTARRKLSQNELDGLTSMAFNVGSFGKNLKRVVRAGSKSQVKYWMRRYIRAGGRILNGLIKRREAESNVYCNDAKTINRFSSNILLYTITYVSPAE